MEWKSGFARTWQFLLNGFIFAVQDLGDDGAFRPYLSTRLETLTDGYVVLNFCYNCKRADNSPGYEKTSLAWLAKSTYVVY